MAEGCYARPVWSEIIVSKGFIASKYVIAMTDSELIDADYLIDVENYWFLQTNIPM